MNLSEKRIIFTRNIARLILWGFDNGYKVAANEVKRGDAQAAANAAAGIGIDNSLHKIGLAADLLLYVDGVYRSDTAAYKRLGDYWKTLDPLNCWGGDFFLKPDGNHFSMTHNGVK